MSNPRDEMSSFLIGVFNIVNKEWGTTMLHYNMTLFRFIVNAQSIKESKLECRGRAVKKEEPMIKVNLGSRRGIQIKMFLVLLRLTMKEVVVRN